MKKIKLDCPLCGVFMSKLGGRKRHFMFECPLCKSLFMIYQGPDKKANAHVNRGVDQRSGGAK